MKVLVAGSRTIIEVEFVHRAILKSGFRMTELVSGTCKGVDRLAEEWAASRGIPIRRFPAQWDLHGRSAGFKRNAEMVEYVAAWRGGVIAVWDGVSKGTLHTINLAYDQSVRGRLQLFVMKVPPEDVKAMADRAALAAGR